MSTRMLSSGDPNELNMLTERIIGCAIEVHRHLGPGLLERSYLGALSTECRLNGLAFDSELSIPAMYKGEMVGSYRIDMIVEGAVLVEIKSVERFEPVFHAQVLSYLRATGLSLGLLVNFNSRLLKEGIKRYILSPPSSMALQHQR